MTTKDEAFSTERALKLALEALEFNQARWQGKDEAITAIKQALAAPVQSAERVEPVAWPAGLIDRIKAAEQRIQDGHAPRRIPADPTDVDLVLAEVRYLLEGKQPPFWIKTTPPAVQPTPVQEPVAIYQYQLASGSWIDQPKDSYDYNVRHGQATVRIVYTTPPAAQRQWVGLTDEEEDAAFEQSMEVRPKDASNKETRRLYAQAIEAKLKEKNA